MRKFLILMLLFFLGVSVNLYGQDENWFTNLNKIKLTSSTKEDVEKLFDFPPVHYQKKFPGYEAVTYATKDGLLSVDYSLGECVSRDSESINLKDKTVFEISFSSDVPLNKKKIKLDLTDFDVEKSYDTPHWIYQNKEKTIMYSLWKNNKLDYVRYSLKKNFYQQYDCIGPVK